MKQEVKPLKQKQRRIAVNYQRVFDQMIEDMIISKKISPTHTSPWVSRPRLLRKKDGSIRVRIDYQYLNSCTQKISYSFPFAEEIFARLTHATYFTVIDLTSGYFQVPLDPASRSCTVFMFSKGIFKFNVLPMGVTNAVETFQRLIDHVLKGLIGHICEVYLDNIIIYSSSKLEHLKHVKIIVDRLKQNNLIIKLSKCKIAHTEVVYLSHTISKGTMKPSQEKVKDLLKYTSPLTT